MSAVIIVIKSHDCLLTGSTVLLKDNAVGRPLLLEDQRPLQVKYNCRHAQGQPLCYEFPVWCPLRHFLFLRYLLQSPDCSLCRCLREVQVQ